MIGAKIPINHGASIRLRVETQIGYKRVKFLQKIVAAEAFTYTAKDIKHGWSWYMGI